MAALIVEKAATATPITLGEAKNFLRVSITDDDDLITSLIVAATEVAEAFTNRSFCIKGFRQSLDSFPYFVDTVMSQMAYPPSYYSLPRYSTTLWNYSQMIKLFRPPLVSIDRISYLSANDSQWHDLVLVPPLWYPDTDYAANDQVMDNNANVWECIFPGTSGHNPPAWNPAIGSIITDNGTPPTVEDTVPIVNGSFETPALTPDSGQYTAAQPPGWILTGAGGVWAPVIPGPQYAALAGQSHQFGYITAGSTLQQITNEVMKTGEFYELHLFVGWRSDMGATSSTVALIDENGHVLTQQTPTLVQGEFVLVTLQYTATANDAGKRIGILLTSNSGQGNFDELSLTATEAAITLTWQNQGPIAGNKSAFGAYITDNSSEPARIFPGPPGFFWPPVLYVPNAVQIHFTAGYAVDGSQIGNGPGLMPGRVKMAILQTVANWYENRESVQPGTLKELPQHCQMILWSLRVLDMQPTRG